MANQTIDALSSSQGILATTTIVETIPPPGPITVQPSLQTPTLILIASSTCLTSTSQYSSILSPTPVDTSVSDQSKDPKQPRDAETLSSDAKIGIAIAATVVVCALLCLLILLFIKHRKKWAKQSPRQISASDLSAGSQSFAVSGSPLQKVPEANSDAIAYSNNFVGSGPHTLNRLGSATTADSSTVCIYELPGAEPLPSTELMTEANRHELTTRSSIMVTSVPNVLRE